MIENQEETLQAEQQDSQTSDPVQQVLGIVQLQELILQYAASSEKFSDAKQLRLVSKSWRELAFKGLLYSTDLPIIELSLNRNPTYVNVCHVFKGIEAARIKIPTSSHIASLSSPKLPFQLQFSVRGSPEIIPFLREYRKYITSIFAEYSTHIGIREKRSDPEICINEPLVLPNLRFLNLRFGYKDFEPLHLLGFHLTHDAKRLSKFEYNVGNARLENLPPNLTHLSILTHSFDSASWLEKHNLPCLISLSLCGFGNLRFRPWITEILRKFQSTLEYIKINLTLSIDSFETPWNLDFQPLEICNMPKLKVFKIRAPICTPSDVKLSDFLPRLTCLQLSLMETTDLAMLEHSSFADLKDLSISFASTGDITPLNSVINFVARQEKTNGLLKSFKMILELPYASLVEACPLIFSQLGSSLTYFCVKLCLDEEVDIEGAFTGISKDQIPNDEASWPDILIGNRSAVTNLKRLECLQIDAFIRLSRENSLSRYIFELALFQMPELRLLQITPKIQVEENLVEQWKERNRNIEIQEYFHVVLLPPS